MRKKMLAQAITLSLLLAAPSAVWAATSSIGTVTINGTVQDSVSCSGDFTVGSSETSSVVITSAADARALDLQDSNDNGKIYGQNISIEGGTRGVNVAYGKLAVGSSETEKVTIKSNSNIAVATFYENASLVIDGENITISSDNERGAHAQGGAVLTIGSDSTSTVNISGVNFGTVAYGSSTFDIKGQNIEIISATGYGVVSEENSKVNIGSDNTTTVNISGKNWGAFAYGSSELDIKGQTIEITSTTGRGVESSTNSTINLGDVNTQSITVSTGGTIGIFALKSEINIITNDLIVEVTGENAQGIHVQNNTQTVEAPEGAASMTIDAENIKITSTGAGISAFSNGQMNISGNLEVTATNAIDVRGYSTVNINTDGEHTTVLNGDIVFETPNTPENANNSGNLINAYVNVNLTGEGSSWTGKAYQEYGNGTSVELNAEPYYGNVTGLNLTIADNAEWNMTGDSFVNTVTVENGGTVNVSEDVAIFNADDAEFDGGILNVEADDATLTVNTLDLTGATVNLNGDGSTLTSPTNEAGEEASYYINATDGTTINFAGSNNTLTSEALTVTGSAINFTGDGNSIEASDNGVVSGTDISFAGSSNKVDVNSVAAVAGNSIAFDGSSNELNATTLAATDSAITFAGASNTVNAESMALTGTGVTFDGDGNTVAADAMALDNTVVNFNGSDNIMNIGELSGSDTTVNITDLSNSITAAAGSVTNLTVVGVGMADTIAAETAAGESATATALANVVTTGDTIAATTVTTDEGIIAGAYTAIYANGVQTSAVQSVNPVNEAVSNLASISLMTWRQENNDMNKRMGELRDSKGQHGVWARMSRGEAKYGNQGVKNQYNYYQIGYDEKLSSNPNWTVGVALTYTDGESSFAGGRGENTHKGLAIYGSYLADNGSFIDLIAKYARLEHEFTTTNGIGDGDYDSNGYSFSVEYGKRFTGDSGLWIEPQVELTYGNVTAADYYTKNGASVHQDSMNSLVGRLGFALGKNIKQGNIYVRASYLYDFDGETSVTMRNSVTSAKFEQDLGGGWWEVGIGTNLNLSDATHLYFDVEKTYGGDVTTPWQWNTGIRWSF